MRFLLYSLKEDDFLKENTFGDDYFDGGFLSLYLEAQNNQKQPEITKHKPLIINTF